MQQLWRPTRTLLGLLLRRPILGTSIIPVLPNGQIVLIQRRDSGLWGLPGGIVDWGEDIPTAAKRELAEETGLKLLSVGRLVGIYSAPQRDPRFHAVCVALEAQVDGRFQIFDTAEIMDVKAFALEEIPLDDLAHDHTQQLQDYLSGKVVLA
ncbi:NUDIX hydrolase [Romeria aff. gracilis LEGE 07310]|uniref:NUDIX hydrolase n=1 Tax=Vasconcelosia minhoensis LEGE 07310 TaxID=915328 RepID=A0A8J7DBI5_9CYAN|nr:NUDIX hydrolase [Romeria gracilis]MBE9076448.1 NUDIX hydrolase [Romeria aff. gracilis LEGE 07310]